MKPGDKRLESVSLADVAAKVERKAPICAKELAVFTGRGFNTVCGWLGKLGNLMPRMGRYFYYADFQAAWSRLKQTPAAARPKKSAQHTRGTSSASTAGKSDGSHP